MIESASTGAIAAIKVVASVAANLIAILGLVAFLDAALSYFGSRVGYPELSFQVRIPKEGKYLVREREGVRI